jgi:colanic acid biosynthesis glycosyl transferase WcaI
MKILVHDYAGHPFQVQLSRSLAKRGHQVLHLYAGSNTTPHGQLELGKEDPSSLRIDNVTLHQPCQKYSLFKRWRQAHEYGYLLANRISLFHPDVVISGNTPLDSQAYILRQCIHRDIKFLFWLQDLEGIATHRILKRKIPLIGTLVGNYYISLEKKLLRGSDRIVAITEDFVPLLVRYGIAEQKIAVIQNWATLENLTVCPKNNSWSRAHKISDKFTFLYTGSMGMKHDPQIIVDLALHYKDNSNVVVLVISEGLGAAWLEQKRREYQLSNLQILPYQSYEDMPNVLASGDVLLTILGQDAGFFSVPSKVLSYLCAQRPLLLSVPLENLSARIVIENNAGLCVPSKDIKPFLCAADKLFEDPSFRETCGSNARAYAETHFDIEAITDSFINLMNVNEMRTYAKRI